MVRVSWAVALVVVLGGCTVSFSRGDGNDNSGLDGGVDAAQDAAVCYPTEAVETHCGDGVDNDCDGMTDCGDPHCGAQPCDDGDPTTSDDTCQAGICAGSGCTPNEIPEQSCGDGADNDCNQLTDCEDPDCEGQPCDDGDPDTYDDICHASGLCEGVTCTDTWVCSQCGTGVCHDVLVHEDSPNCGCAESVPAPNCNNIPNYFVDCGGGYQCEYDRREITEDCNCHWECL